MRLLALAVVAVAAVLAAPAAFAAQGEPQEKHTAADNAKARSIVLKLRDLPGTGWTAEKDTSPDDDPLRCAGFNPDLSDLVETGDAESPNFDHKASGSFVSSTGSLFRSEVDANQGFDRVVKPGLIRCLQRVLEGESTAAAKIAVKRAGVFAFPKVGDESRAYRVQATVTASGQTVPVVLDIVLFRSGRADVAFLALGIGGAFPSVRPLVATLERRAAAVA
jgi:hypothetical protein